MQKKPPGLGGSYIFFSARLVCAFEFSQEARIVLREHTQVADAVFQVSDSLYAHSEGIARVNVRVDAFR